MKKSSIFISEINFKIKESKQLQSTLKHNLRTYSRFNVDETNEKNNIYSLNPELQDYIKTIQKEKITQENISKYIMNYVEEMKKQYEIKTNTTQEIFKSNDNIRDLKKTSKRRLENKNMDMTLERLEEQLTEEIETEEQLLNKITEYVNSKWDNTKYKSESQSTRLKNNVINSVFKYETNKKNYVKTSKKESLNINNTYVQELVFKPLTKGSFQMNNEELLSLRKKIIEQEKRKGNIVLASRIHNDESSPHIHCFIFSKDFNVGQNQVNFINKKYNKSFNSVLTQDEKTEYGQLKQKHYYEMVNSVLEDDKKFVLKHLVNEKINSNEEIEQLTEEEQLSLNNRNDERKRENRRIKIRTGKTSISKRKYNRKTLMLENQELELKKLNQMEEQKFINEKKELLSLQVQIKFMEEELKELQEEKEKQTEQVNKIKETKLNIIKDTTDFFNKYMKLFEDEDITFSKIVQFVKGFGIFNDMKKHTEVKNKIGDLIEELSKKQETSMTEIRKEVINSLKETEVIPQEQKKQIIDEFKIETSTTPNYK